MMDGVSLGTNHSSFEIEGDVLGFEVGSLEMDGMLLQYCATVRSLEKTIFFPSVCYPITFSLLSLQNLMPHHQNHVSSIPLSQYQIFSTVPTQNLCSTLFYVHWPT